MLFPNEGFAGEAMPVAIHAILNDVRTAGAIAWEMQQRLSFSEREYKSDESVVTEADHRIEEFLCQRIAAEFPAANIISEEAKRPFDPEKPLTFAVDPIDGTDVYSQGMTGWCISVGLLDEHLVPTAGIIFAPRLDLLLVADAESGATLNGAPLPSIGLPESISIRSNLMVTSRIHQHLDLRGFVGKIRGIGSAALHLCYPLIYRAVIGAVEGPGAHIWDIAAAHAINRARDGDLVYLNGEKIDYRPLTDGRRAQDVIMGGHPLIVGQLRQVLRRLD